MAAPLLFDAVRESTATTGTGAVTLGGAMPPFRSFAAAGVPDGATVRYSIATPASLPTALEWGYGVYTLATSSLTRNLVGSTTGALLVLAGTSAVSITPIAVDLVRVGSFTLTASATSTVVTDASCSAASVVVPVAGTQHAALAIPSMWIVPGAGSFTVYHANNTYVDRTFSYVIR
jgi:hypothetical protein